MAGTYTTRVGDTWDGISFRVYGTELHMDLLLDANPEQNYIAIFDDGVGLIVPDLPTPAPTTTNLPPWKLP